MSPTDEDTMHPADAAPAAEAAAPVALEADWQRLKRHRDEIAQLIQESGEEASRLGLNAFERVEHSRKLSAAIADLTRRHNAEEPKPAPTDA